MADFTPSRIGADNSGADKLALFLKVFSGMVLSALYRKNVTMDKHLVRTITSGN